MAETQSEQPIIRQNETRRQFLINSARLAAGVVVGLTIGLPKSKVQAHEDKPTEPNVEIERRRVKFNEIHIETALVDTLVLADKVCFYTDAPFTNTEGGSLPENNDQFYHHRRAELLGFVDKPNFLVLHTDAGNDTRITIQSLNRRNIQCQFMVGTIEGEAASIQATYLQRNRINVTNTVGGAEVNPYEANIQFWGSLNVEIQGYPNDVDSPLIDKATQLCLDIMPVYGLKMSQVIGHMEVPHNGKPDPGRAVLREIRTRVYQELLGKGLYNLIDVFPGETSALSNFFTVNREHSGEAQFNEEGRVKCWLQDGDSYVDWNRINSFLADNPELSSELQRYRDGSIQIIPTRQRQNRELNEVYMGFPPSFTDWLRQPTKALGAEEFSTYRPSGTAKFIYRIRNILCNNSDTVGSTLPFSYEVAQNLARMFIAEQPYENRGNEIPDAMVSVAENIGDTNLAWQRIRTIYQEKYGSSVV